MISFRISERSIGNRIRSVYPGASLGLTGRRKTREDRWVESFFQTARSLSGVVWSRLYSAWLGRNPNRLNWENSFCNEFDGGDVTEGVAEEGVVEVLPSEAFLSVSDGDGVAAMAVSLSPAAAVPHSALLVVVVVAAALPPEALTVALTVVVAVAAPVPAVAVAVAAAAGVGSNGCGGLGPLFLYVDWDNTPTFWANCVKPCFSRWTGSRDRGGRGVVSSCRRRPSKAERVQWVSGGVNSDSSIVSRADVSFWVGGDVVDVDVDVDASLFRPSLKIRISSSRAASQTLASETISFSSRLGIPSINRWRDDFRRMAVASDEAMAISSSKVREEDEEDSGGNSPIPIPIPIPLVFFFFFTLGLPPVVSVLLLLLFWFSSLLSAAFPPPASTAAEMEGVSLRGRFFDATDVPLALIVTGVVARLALLLLLLLLPPAVAFLVAGVAVFPSPIVVGESNRTKPNRIEPSLSRRCCCCCCCCSLFAYNCNTASGSGGFLELWWKEMGSFARQSKTVQFAAEQNVRRTYRRAE